MNKQKFSLKKRLKSFIYAFHGLCYLIKNEHNARIHLLAAVCVVIAGFCFKISVLEWIIVTFACGIVIVTEIFNSSIERLADLITKDKNLRIKELKDLSAAAVFVAAIVAAIIGLIIFVPYLINIFKL